MREDRRLSTSVLLYSVGDLDLRAKLFLWTSRIKKDPSGGSLGVDPLLELNELCMVESLESALAWIKCQVIGPGLLKGLHYLKVLTQVHCERVPNG